LNLDLEIVSLMLGCATSWVISASVVVGTCLKSVSLRAYGFMCDLYHTCAGLSYSYRDIFL